MSYEEIVNEKFNKIKDKKDIIILGIESSCDETAAAVVKGGREVLSNVVASQIDIHRRFGGVVPEIASRNHITAIDNVVNNALKDANMTFKDIDCIAVTYGAGLLGALLVGVSYAKALSFAKKIPLIAVSHIKGHISANYVASKELEPPYMCLLCSGGHTAIIKTDDYDKVELIGSTLDDAVGEAFDKVARVLGLHYPGGPEVQKLAESGKPTIKFNKPFKGEKTYNFSYSGLKTGVINYIHNNEEKGVEINKADVACSFQETAVSMLVDNVVRAAVDYNMKKIVVAGGVGANKRLREMLKEKASKKGIEVYYPPLNLCTDNAVMIASAGYFMIKSGCSLAPIDLDASSTVKIV